MTGRLQQPAMVGGVLFENGFHNRMDDLPRRRVRSEMQNLFTPTISCLDRPCDSQLAARLELKQHQIG